MWWLWKSGKPLGLFYIILFWLNDKRDIWWRIICGFYPYHIQMIGIDEAFRGWWACGISKEKLENYDDVIKREKKRKKGSCYFPFLLPHYFWLSVLISVCILFPGNLNIGNMPRDILSREKEIFSVKRERKLSEIKCSMIF